MTHRAGIERAVQVLAAVAIAFGILAAAPMAEAFRSAPEAVAPADRVALGPFAEGDLVARLTVSRLAVDAPVFEGVDGHALSRGAGHIPGTALPGEEGGTNHSLVAIPRDSAASGISEIRVGDAVTMRTPFGMRNYRVAERRVVDPRAVVARPSRRPRVTLVTPFPADEVGPAPLRLTVVLEQT
ncbi:MAG: class D sortase [Acidobacteriota bacterium]